MPIRNENIDLLLLVAGEFALNDEEHFESYLFINGTTLYTNDSYFSTKGWIDPGTCYHLILSLAPCEHNSQSTLDSNVNLMESKHV